MRSVISIAAFIGMDSNDQPQPCVEVKRSLSISRWVVVVIDACASDDIGEPILEQSTILSQGDSPGFGEGELAAIASRRVGISFAKSCVNRCPGIRLTEGLRSCRPWSDPQEWAPYPKTSDEWSTSQARPWELFIRISRTLPAQVIVRVDGTRWMLAHRGRDGEVMPPSEAPEAYRSSAVRRAFSRASNVASQSVSRVDLVK